MTFILTNPQPQSPGRSLRRRAAAAWICLVAAGLLVGLASVPPALADPKPIAREPLRPAGIDGALVICGGGKLPEAIL